MRSFSSSLTPSAARGGLRGQLGAERLHVAVGQLQRVHRVALPGKVQAVFPRAGAQVQDAHAGAQVPFHNAHGGQKLHPGRLRTVQPGVFVKQAVQGVHLLGFVLDLPQCVQVGHIQTHSFCGSHGLVLRLKNAAAFSPDPSFFTAGSSRASFPV